MNIVRGRTSQIVPVRAVDTNGIPKTGLLFNTSGLACVYKRELAASPVSITLATMTAGTWSTGGFVEENSSSMPGVYELGVPDAAISASDASTWVVIQFVGTNVYFQPIRIDLVAYDPQNAVRLGLTALPNANANAANGLYTRGTGAGQINQSANGQIDVNVAAMANDVVTANAIATDALGSLELSSAAISEIQSGLATSGDVTTITTAIAAVQSDTNDIQTRLPDALVDGSIKSYTTDLADDVITEDKVSSGFIDAIKSGIWSYLLTDLQALATTKVGRWLYDKITAIKAKTDTIGTTTLTAVSPVTYSGATVTTDIIISDDYFEDEGLSLDYTRDNWPDLTDGGDAVVTWRAAKADGASLSVVGEVVAARQIRFELPSADSADLAIGNGRDFTVVAVMAGTTHEVSLIPDGVLNVTRIRKS